MDFVAIDVETANPQMASICQIGLVGFSEGREVMAESRFIDPEDHFDPIQMNVHGIAPERIVGAPTFGGAFDWLRDCVGDAVLVSHTVFDRTAIRRACTRYSVGPLECRWLDSSLLARRAWPDVRDRGYGLANLAARFGIAFQHHDALQDARAAGLVLLQALHFTGLDVEHCLEPLSKPLGVSSRSVRRAGDGDGPLLGETVVITGTLSLPRQEVADLIHVAGGEVGAAVTKTTTILVVGDQDLSRLAGKSKSSKHLKAEQLIISGQRIRILGESDLVALVE